MKIKEVMEIIKESTDIEVKNYKSSLCFFAKDNYDDWFLKMSVNTVNWDDVCIDPSSMYGVPAITLARVMNVVQQLIDTPVKDRFPEKKYYLRWIDNRSGSNNYLSIDRDGDWEVWDELDYTHIFTESQIKQLKKDYPRWAPAIDVMKEPAEDKDE